MCTSSPQDKIVEFIQMTPFKSLHTLDYFNTVLLPEWSTAVFCVVIVVHESLVYPEQLNCWSSEKSFSSHKFFRFPAFLCIWTLSKNYCRILRAIFSHWGQLRDSFATITEDSNAHWCSRRKNHALSAGAWKLLNRMKICLFILFCLNVIFFHLVLPFRSYRR